MLFLTLILSSILCAIDKPEKNECQHGICIKRSLKTFNTESERYDESIIANNGPNSQDCVLFKKNTDVLGLFKLHFYLLHKKELIFQPYHFNLCLFLVNCFYSNKEKLEKKCAKKIIVDNYLKILFIPKFHFILESSLKMLELIRNQGQNDQKIFGKKNKTMPLLSELLRMSEETINSCFQSLNALKIEYTEISSFFQKDFGPEKLTAFIISTVITKNKIEKQPKVLDKAFFNECLSLIDDVMECFEEPMLFKIYTIPFSLRYRKILENGFSASNLSHVSIPNLVVKLGEFKRTVISRCPLSMEAYKKHFSSFEGIENKKTTFIQSLTNLIWLLGTDHSEENFFSILGTVKFYITNILDDFGCKLIDLDSISIHYDLLFEIYRVSEIIHLRNVNLYSKITKGCAFESLYFFTYSITKVYIKNHELFWKNFESFSEYSKIINLVLYTRSGLFIQENIIEVVIYSNRFSFFFVLISKIFKVNYKTRSLDVKENILNLLWRIYVCYLDQFKKILKKSLSLNGTSSLNTLDKKFLCEKNKDILELIKEDFQCKTMKKKQKGSIDIGTINVINE